MTSIFTTLTVDSNPASFWIGTIVTTVTYTSVPSTTTSGIITDTSLPPTSTTMAPTGTVSSAASSAKPTSTSSGPTTGQLVGIIVGSVAGGLLLIAIIFWFCWRRKRKIAARRRTKARIDSPKRITRSSFPIHASHLRPDRVAANQQVGWPRSVNPDSIGLALSPDPNGDTSQRQTQIRSGTRSFLPISAPILEDRASGPSSFRERFFAEPRLSSRTQQYPTKHVSDATTIRTSCTLPTPDRPSIAFLRPWSSATSATTAFEEDMEFQPEPVPPLPTWKAAEVPLTTTDAGRKQGKPARLDLEAGIRRNFNKAISYVPMTPRYDNGYHVSQRQPSGHTVPTSKLRTSKSIEKSRQNTASTNGARYPRDMITPTRQPNVLPTTTTPQFQPLDIPGRDSSFKHFMDNGDHQWLLRQSTKPTPEPMTISITRPSLSINQNQATLAHSPIRNLSYPRIPLSASETHIDHTRSNLQSSIKKGGTHAHASDIERYSHRPLPQIVISQNIDDPFSGPSGTTKLFHTPLRLHVPSTPIRNRHSQHSQTSATSHRATFTPNRTNTGDLVLTVDM